jgi:putative nucleotidyltransferase with HDIG domain
MSRTRSQFATRLLSQIYLFAQIALGAATLLGAIADWHSSDPIRLVSFAVAAVFGSMLKLRLPGVRSMVSGSALFILVAIVNLSLPEALAVGALAMLVQCTWRTSAGPKLTQAAFSISVFVTAVFISAKVFEFSHRIFLEPVSFVLLAVAFYCANTFPIATIIGLTENQSILKIWASQRWLLPYYVAGASMAWVIGTLPRGIQWEFPLICLPLVYLVHRSNRTHVLQMEGERAHMQALNGLHLRTIEALALAIDAKDHATHDHLQRVQLYATEIGKDLGLSDKEQEALTAAAVLHDIGKLAVPESIISKPGKLTRSEFEKMKIHPVVGAEILERVEFPYPVVPIVRSHHEKWDGSGYPYGLRGEEIPIGARILSAVDCLDALASDRQYRRALPLDEAMARVASEAGTAFDPRVVQALQARYQELEARARSIDAPVHAPLSVNLKIANGSAPAAGFEAEAPATASAPMHPVAQARAAHQKAVSMPDMPEAGICSLRWEEALLVASLRIHRAISYDAMALCACEDDFVRVKFAGGDDRAGLESLAVRQGEGLVGWVAEVGKPILNGNPAVEPGYSATRLVSALALPLVSAGRVVGVVALYRREKDAFASDELIALLELCPALAALILDGGESSNNLLEMASAVRRAGLGLL